MLTEPILFLATANSKASRTFYESRVGLTFVSDTPFALVFKVGDTELRIQKVLEVQDVPYTVLGWCVADIEQALEELECKGVKFEVYDDFEQDEREIWRSPSGALVASFTDPDDNILSITQH